MFWGRLRERDERRRRDERRERDERRRREYRLRVYKKPHSPLKTP